MTNNDRINELLDRWEEAAGQGQDLSPEELCESTPELLASITEKISSLKAMNELLDAEGVAQTGTITNPHESPIQSREQMAERFMAEIELKSPRFLARGGLGAVYTVNDSQLNREVAVKFIDRKAARNESQLEHFCIEAEITSRLDHPGVVPVHAIGKTKEGRPFYVMRFVRGSTLESAIERFFQESKNWQPQYRNLEFRKLLNCFVAVCQTIAYAHNRGIIHRDIKPDNVMIGRYGETLVVDWGLAIAIERDAGARKSGEGTLVIRKRKCQSTESAAGTPAYMSPEQATGDEGIGPASDIYNLGATLYKILTGQRAIDTKGLGLGEIKKRIKEGQIPRPRQINPAAPGPLEAICLKAMNVTPSERYESADALAEDVERFLADEKVSAHQEDLFQKSLRWLRRHRGMTYTIVLSAAALFAVLMASSVLLSKLANTAKLESEQSMRLAAQFAADVVASEIERRWEILENRATEPVLIDLLSQADLQPRDPTLQGWLQQIHDNDTSSSFVCNAQGLQVGRWPEEGSKSIGSNYAHRNYFHGNGPDILRTEVRQPPQHINATHLSLPYPSTSEVGRLKVAFTIPIWINPDEKQGFLGILGMSLTLGDHLNMIQQKLDKVARNQVAVLAYFNHENETSKGLILEHPLFKEIPNLSLEFEFNSLENLDFISDYRDPAGKFSDLYQGVWAAAFEPIQVDHPEDPNWNTEWVVIVQKR